mmetsp:Transcript_69175/g.126247  ORF Transcript_69175/g.126247 Transcript_69175/m.126247 type:complete len:276 (-) Transcript_69175:733-1560(-)
MLVLANFCDGSLVVIGCIDFGNGFVLCLGVFRNLCLELRNHGIVDLDLPIKVRHCEVDLLIFVEARGLLVEISSTFGLQCVHHFVNSLDHSIKMAHLCRSHLNCKHREPEAVALSCAGLQDVVGLDTWGGRIHYVGHLEEGGQGINAGIRTGFLAGFDRNLESIASLVSRQDLDCLLNASNLFGTQLLSEAPLLKFDSAGLLCLIKELDVGLLLTKSVIIFLGCVGQVCLRLCKLCLLPRLYLFQVCLGLCFQGHLKLVIRVPLGLQLGAALQVR